MAGSQTRPSIDHFVGQPVKKIRSVGKEDWEWAVVMEDGSVFKNHDKRRTAAPDSELEGQVLSMAIFNELDTRVVFGGGGEVVFTPTQYSISQGGNKEEFFPHMVDEEEQIPPVEFPAELEQRMQPGPVQAAKRGGKSSAKKNT